MVGDGSLDRHATQIVLQEYLTAELSHTLGAYALAVRALERLTTTRLEREVPAPWRDRMKQVTADSIKINELLRQQLHLPADLRPRRSALFGDRAGHIAPLHPHPDGAAGETTPEDWPPPPCAEFITDFYATAAAALNSRQCRHDNPSRLPELGGLLSTVHDPHRRSRATPSDSAAAGRRQRYVERGERAARVLGVGTGRVRPEVILDSQLWSEQPDSLVGHVLDAFNEAHRCMHRAEHFLSHSIGDKLTFEAEIDEAAGRELERSLVLNTFAYVAARSAPWAFAQDEEERHFVVNHWERSCEHLSPNYCMWLPRQISLLALHRRAYTYLLLRGRTDDAYRDFHKLVRFLRAVRPDVQRRAVRAPGAMRFVDGMTAIAEHHTGRIYRHQHAYKVALKYFNRASARIEPWADTPEIRDILVNSRWRINLLVGHAKASYELGHIKECLLSYARAWHALLELIGSESRSSPNFEVVDGFIAWISEIRHDPDINKLQLRAAAESLVRQFETVLGPAHLRLLAADIMMRFGHVLFILKLTDDDGQPDNTLAARCLIHAAELDRFNTLIAGDLRKMAYLNDTNEELADRLRAASAQIAPVDSHWPSGGGRFEETARVIEYVLQTWIDDAPAAKNQARPAIARRLLASFLAHTDSSNVKLAQVYRYLSQERYVRTEALAASAPTLDLVCLRRYSSFFPFLPRPSASRAPGGGYLVHLHDHEREPFGVAIDPGPDFADNLYRCGYGLADIDLIVITHDHADHIASLDALLSLLGYRQRASEPPFDKQRRLTLVGNTSVCRRYSHFDDTYKDPIKILSFGEFHGISCLRGQEREQAIADQRLHLVAETLEIAPVQTYDHLDGAGAPAQGFLLSVGDGPDRSSVLFTSDTAPITPTDPAAPRRTSEGTLTLAEAVAQARVVVAHLSSVPLRELRVLADLDNAPPKSAHITAAFETMWRAHRRDAPNSALAQQVEFAFRSQPADKNDDSVTPLSPVEVIQSRKPMHLFLTGVLEIAEIMSRRFDEGLLVLGELREELGTFRSRVAHQVNERLFKSDHRLHALTGDIGLKVHLEGGDMRVLCSTCDLDNDLIPVERLHRIHEIHEVCVKGEDEAIFYNCDTHNPAEQDEPRWLEAVERYDLFGD
jgi:tetratricopeptide (TPR) repeat protein